MINLFSVLFFQGYDYIAMSRLRGPYFSIKAGRLFNFHGNLFELQFTVELEPGAVPVAVAAPQEGDAASGRTGSLEDGQQERMDTDRSMVTGGGSSGAQNNGGQHPGTTPRTRQAAGAGVDAKDSSEEVLSGGEIYDLLMKAGAIGNSGQFVWDSTPVGAAVAEVSQFWEEELTSFQQTIDEKADAEEVKLPEDILPTTKEVWATSKTSKWGPVPPTRKSNRIDSSKRVVDKAIEYKKMTNLEIPRNKKMSGIMHSNPFNLLSLDVLDDMANNIGVCISRDSFSSTADLASTENSCPTFIPDPEQTPVQHIDVIEQDDRGEGVWTEVHRRRGKHPRKSFR